MNIREKISNIVIEKVADIFALDEKYVAEHPELNFRKDLGAKSLQYFPLVTALETELDIELEYHEFQIQALTIELAIDFVIEAYNKSHK